MKSMRLSAGADPAEVSDYASYREMVEAMTRESAALRRVRVGLERVDRRLIEALPSLGRYAWETVITLEK